MISVIAGEQGAEGYAFAEELVNPALAMLGFPSLVSDQVGVVGNGARFQFLLVALQAEMAASPIGAPLINASALVTRLAVRNSSARAPAASSTATQLSA